MQNGECRMQNEQKAVSLTYFNVWQRHTNAG